MPEPVLRLTGKDRLCQPMLLVFMLSSVQGSAGLVLRLTTARADSYFWPEICMSVSNISVVELPVYGASAL